MSKFTLPINWQEDYWDVIDFTDVVEVHGKLREDFIGGGRSYFSEPDPSKKMVENFIKEAHSRNIEVNYLLNATCIGNVEATAKGHKQIRKTLDWLSTIDVDTITLSLPMLAHIIKRYYPHFKISVSTLADVDCLEKAKYWEDIGVDVITLSYTAMNRNFLQLKRITENCSFISQLIPNTFCRKGCPVMTMHGNFTSHASTTREKKKRYNQDYYIISCIEKDFSDPERVIKSNWIRPEDLEIYEKLGVKRFKLLERSLKSEHISKILDAYRNHSYDGNLYDIAPSVSKCMFSENPTIPSKAINELRKMPLSHLLNLRKNVKRLNEATKQEAHINDNFYIDNKKLDGAIQYFIDRGCMQTTCDDCNYCEELTKKAVKFQNIDGYKKIFADIIDDVITGKFV